MADSLTVVLQDELSPAAVSAAIAQVARQELAAAQEVNRVALGRVPAHETIVDGSRGGRIENVRPNGSIVFAFDVDLLGGVLAWISEQLVMHSPRLTGRYSDSHMLFADGVESRPNDDIQGVKEFAFINAQPYARKIERGLSSQAPEGVFQAVAKLASRRLGNMAQVRFSYRSFPGGAVGAWAGRTSLKGKSPSVNRPGVKRQDWLTRQPAIIVTPR